MDFVLLFSRYTRIYSQKLTELFSGGVAGYSTVLTDRKLEMDQFHQTFSGEVPVIICRGGKVHNKRSPLAEQHVCWKEQDRDTLNFQ